MNTENIKILLVDDEPDVLEFLGYNLKKEGYQVFQARNGIEALSAAKSVSPHLILLDVMMPEMDGIETCTEIRKISALKEVVIIFLTARGEDYSQIAGFEAGADDYVTKPVKPKVLISRIKALLRRHKDESVDPDQPLEDYGDFTIDRERYIVISKGKELVFPRKEFQLLSLLTSKPNKVFTREEILSGVWGNNVVVGDRTIDVHIRKIREKLETDRIRTVKGVGYKFEF